MIKEMIIKPYDFKEPLFTLEIVLYTLKHKFNSKKNG